MTRSRRALLLAAVAGACVAGSVRSAHEQQTLVGPRQAYLFLVPGVTLDELIGSPNLWAVARAGGSGFVSDQVDADNPAYDPASWRGMNVFLRAFPTPPTGAMRARAIDRIGDRIRTIVPSTPGVRVLVVIVSSSSSPSQRAAKDELLPIIVADVGADRLFHVQGPLRSLTSDSTRRGGIVADVDIAPTVLRFLSRPDPSIGAPIRVLDEPPPFDLHERYLAQRRMVVPVGTAAALYVTGAGLLAVAITVRREDVPDRWARVVAWASLSVPMLATGLLAAGHLADLSYATAIPMVALVTVFGTMAFSPLERRDPTSVPAAIGLVVLAFFAAEALLGWPAMLTPLLGGSQLDGGRFYGLPNVAIGLLVGAALWVAQRTRTFAGFWLLCGVGLFAGLPLLGANLGGAVTGFAAAGLWLAVRERERLGVRVGVAVSLVVTAVGTAVILVAHAISPVATHIADFEENVEGIGGVLEAFVDRLRVGFDLIAGSPAALVPVLGLPVALLVALRPPPPIRATFERWPAWRDAVLVTILAGIIAYVVNDSGPAAAGLAFGLGLGGMLGVSLLVPPGKMGTP